MKLLQLDAGSNPRQVHRPCGQTVILGRDTENPIVLRSRAVSRRHARLERSPKGWLITDLGSTNGIAVNGVRVFSAHLRHDDVIQIGDQTLLVEEDEAVASQRGSEEMDVPDDPSRRRALRLIRGTRGAGDSTATVRSSRLHSYRELAIRVSSAAALALIVWACGTLTEAGTWSGLLRSSFETHILARPAASP